ncbi:MAG: choice-of-anchor B family protein, partial [Bacteroidota bacterium]
MKKTVLVALAFAIVQILSAQSVLNMELIANVDYPETCNDIWGYVDDDGREYAILGTTQATAILSLEDPTNPVEVAYIPGSSSVWRDMKSWGDFVYVTTDDGDDGLLIIDMSEAPTTITHRFWRPELSVNGATNNLLRCHNLYIDENGYCYISGSRELNSGGVLIFDVDTDPGNPIYVGAADARYSHDNFSRGDTLWSADIDDGIFSVFDVSDKSNPQLLATQPTSFIFSHNIWPSDDGKYVFTTDERRHAFVDSYDVSDLDNIKRLDSYRPKDTEGTGVIPHNTHYHNGYLVTSWYTDGLKVIDAHKPDNLVEVANYDTNTDFTRDFHGCWGAYPFLPSGLYLASDMENGLFVFRPTLLRACYLEGKATDAVSQQPIPQVTVILQSNFANEAFSDVMGEYKTGLEAPGTYTATYTKPGYEPQTHEVQIDRGEVTIKDVQLQPIASFEGRVIRSSDGATVPDADVVILDQSTDLMFSTRSDVEGNFKMPAFEPGTYTVIGGKWGYLHTTFERQIDANNTVTVVLDDGYQDDFILEQNWTVAGPNSGTDGLWERAIPVATQGEVGGELRIINPGQDVEDDLGAYCYVTGNAFGFESRPGDDDVDRDRVTLTSPPMDLSDYDFPVMSFSYWFFSGLGNSTPNDNLEILLTNGTDEVVIERTPDISLGGWVDRSEIHVADFITPSDSMHIIITTRDNPSPGHWVEGGFDAFLVTDDM